MGHNNGLVSIQLTQRVTLLNRYAQAIMLRSDCPRLDESIVQGVPWVEYDIHYTMPCF